MGQGVRDWLRTPDPRDGAANSSTTRCCSMTTTPPQPADDTWAAQATPSTFYALRATCNTGTYPATGTRLEVRGEDFNPLAVHWSSQAALGHVGERSATGTKAAAYLVAWERIESDDDPRLKSVAGR